MSPNPIELEFPPGISLNNTIGAILIGCLFSISLFGLVCLQVWNYFHEAKDPMYLKFIVWIVWLLELTHTILISHALYVTLISNFGLPSFLIDCPVTLKISIVFSGLVNAIVLSFFGYRVKVLSNRWEIPIAIWFCATVRFVAVVVNFSLVTSRTLLEFSERLGYTLYFPLVLGASTDLFVALALTYYLSRSRSGIETTDHLVSRLILMSIETGLITAIMEIGMLLLFQFMKHNYVWMAILVVVAKAYSNSLMVSLNSRRKFRSRYFNGKTSSGPSNLTEGGGQYSAFACAAGNGASGGEQLQLSIATKTTSSTLTYPPYPYPVQVEDGSYRSASSYYADEAMEKSPVDSAQKAYAV